MLDDAADRAEPRAVWRAHLADAGLDAVLQAEEPAVLGAVVSRVRLQPANGGADDLGQAQQMREEPGVVNVGRGGNCRQRDAVGRGHDVVLGPRLTALPPCRGRWD